MKKTFVIFQKELKDMLRDRKTVFFMILFPLILIPVMMISVPKLFSDAEKKEQEKQLNVVLFGTEYSQELTAHFQSAENMIISMETDTTGMEKRLSNEVIDVAIVISNDFQSDINSMTPARIEVYHQSTDDMDVTKKKIRAILNTYSDSIIQKRFEMLQLKEEIVHPLDISFENFASPREIIGKMAGGFLPYIFVLFCFMGAMYPALDLGAGEKERGTLETLLVSPASRMEILMGKFGVITLSGLASAVFGLLGIFVGITQTGSNEASKVIEVLSEIIQPETIVLVLTLIIPIAVLFSALLLSISIYAKTFKEAQSIIGPLNILFFVPVIVGLVPGIKLDIYTALVPILNISLATKEVIAGTINGWLLVEVYAVMFILAFASIFFAAKWFNKEHVIFRT
ncbi:MAG: ABC transporter permease [Candidatus Marinimicrobia bacterium]|nr:ABC transporter permease [Candidatus Neomarinimicrobiota bacterium]